LGGGDQAGYPRAASALAGLSEGLKLLPCDALWHRANLCDQRANLCDQSILQCFSNSVESLVYGRDLILQGVDLRAYCRVEDADRRATA